MKISIYISEKSLESLHAFIKEPLKYKHNIKFAYSPHLLSFPVVNVIVSYEEYEILNLFKTWRKL